MASVGRHGLDLLVDAERAEAAEWRRHIEMPNEESRVALFDRYRPLALKVSGAEWSKCRGLGLDRCDTDQLAYEALLQAIDRFDPRKGVPFPPFVRPRIRGAIRNALPKAREANAHYGAKKRLERDRLRSLKVASEGVEADPLEKLRELIIGVALGFMLEDASDSSLEIAAAADPSAYERAVWNQLLAELDRRLTDLPPRERLILQYHYRQDVSFTEIAKLLGVSKGRISQIHAQAMKRLRSQLSKFR